MKKEMFNFLKKSVGECKSELDKVYGNDIQIKISEGIINTHICVKLTFHSKKILAKNRY
jgi:hypothetical protein